MKYDGRNPVGETHSFHKKYKGEHYHKWARSPREQEKEERTPEALEGDHYSTSSDESVAPCRKKQRSDDNL